MKKDMLSVPKISIIIPVYNVENYIEGCIKSCVNQTLIDIEIIIVNDASDDNSIEIATKFAKEDNRIKIINHEKNLGLLQARKTGVIHAEGEYIQHLDSDDWLDMNACKGVYSALQASDCDLCHIGTRLWNDDTVIKSCNTYWNTYNEIISSKKLLNLLLTDYIAHGAVTMISRKEIALKAFREMENVKRLVSLEDMIYTFAVSVNAMNCICLSQKLYNYRLNIGMGTRGKKSALEFVSVFHDAKVAFATIVEITKRHKLKDIISDNLRIKKEKHYKKHRLADWDCLSEANKKIAFKLLEKKKILKSWIEVLYEYDRSYEVCCAAELDFDIKLTEGKNIGFFINKMSNGGREKVVQILANHLSQNGWNVVIFTTENELRNDYKLNSSIKRVVLPKRQSIFLKVFVREIRKNSINLIASHNWFDNQSLMIFLYLRLSNVKVCLNDHNGLRSQIFTHNKVDVIKNILAGSGIINGLTCLSRLDASVWRRFGQKVAFMPNPMEINFQKNRIETKEKKIIWIGRLEAVEKQVMQAIRAFAIVYDKRKDLELVIVGAEDNMVLGEYHRKLEKACKKLKCEEGVKFVGFSDDVFSYLKHASLHWMTSAYEGFPMVWVEAKSMGVPTITYDVPWVELNGKGSIVVDQGDYKSMATETLNLFENEEKLQKLSIHAKNDLHERFDRQMVLRRWEAFYLDILKRGETDLFYEKFDGIEKGVDEYFKKYLLQIVYIVEQENIKYVTKKNELQQTKKSKSFLLGSLFFRSVKSPYKLVTFPYNFIKILSSK